MAFSNILLPMCCPMLLHFNYAVNEETTTEFNEWKRMKIYRYIFFYLLIIENSRVENQPTLFLSTQRLNCDRHYFPIRVDHRISRVPPFNWSISRKVMRVLLSKGPIHCLVYLCAIGTRASKNTQFTTENIKENVIHRYDRQCLVYWIILEN